MSSQIWTRDPCQQNHVVTDTLEIMQEMGQRENDREVALGHRRRGQRGQELTSGQGVEGGHVSSSSSRSCGPLAKASPNPTWAFWPPDNVATGRSIGIFKAVRRWRAAVSSHRRLSQARR